MNRVPARSHGRLRAYLWRAALIFALTQSGCQLRAPLHPYLASDDLQLRLGSIDGIEFDEDSFFTKPTGDEATTAEPLNPDDVEQIPPPPPDDEPSFHAPAQVEIRLEDVRAAALENNLTLQIELLNPRIARTGISEEMARFESTFSAVINRDRDDPPPGFGLGGPPNTATGTLGASIDLPLQSGGNVRLNHETFRTDPLITGLPTAFTSSLGVSMTQPLLRGSGFQVNPPVAKRD